MTILGRILIVEDERDVSLSSFHFKRAADSVVQVLNEGSYVMAEYSGRTGTVQWQRLVPAPQREIIEKWLREHYPAKAAAASA